MSRVLLESITSSGSRIGMLNVQTGNVQILCETTCFGKSIDKFRCAKGNTPVLSVTRNYPEYGIEAFPEVPTAGLITDDSATVGFSNGLIADFKFEQNGAVEGSTLIDRFGDEFYNYFFWDMAGITDKAIAISDLLNINGVVYDASPKGVYETRSNTPICARNIALLLSHRGRLTGITQPRSLERYASKGNVTRSISYEKEPWSLVSLLSGEAFFRGHNLDRNPNLVHRKLFIAADNLFTVDAISSEHSASNVAPSHLEPDSVQSAVERYLQVHNLWSGTKLSPGYTWSVPSIKNIFSCDGKVYAQTFSSARGGPNIHALFPVEYTTEEPFEQPIYYSNQPFSVLPIGRPLDERLLIAQQDIHTDATSVFEFSLNDPSRLAKAHTLPGQVRLFGKANNYSL